MSWKHWPYWLRGGVIGGGVALIFYLLAYSCFWLTTRNLLPGEVGLSYSCLIFFIVSPIYPVAWLLSFLEPVFSYSWTFAEAYAPILSIPVWTVVGGVVGSIIENRKLRKKSPL